MDASTEELARLITGPIDTTPMKSQSRQLRVGDGLVTLDGPNPIGKSGPMVVMIDPSPSLR